MNIFDVLLTEAHRKAGLSFTFDDHTIYLHRNGAVVAHFTHYATITNMRHEADQWLELNRSGVSFARS